MKECIKCNVKKEITEFAKNNRSATGYYNYCRSCAYELKKINKAKNEDKYKETQQKWLADNKDRVNEKHKEWLEKNKDTYSTYQKEYNKEYYKDNKENIKNRVKKHKDEHKTHYQNYYRNYKTNRYNTDLLFRLSCNIRGLIRGSIKRKGYTKKSRTYEILGCTFEEFKLHLESKFEPWMTWDNYGLYNGELNYGWDIDHVIPLYPVDVVRTEDDLIKLNHYTNLQPLCSYTNRTTKKNKTHG